MRQAADPALGIRDLFGCARTYAMNSAAVLGGKLLFTTSTNALTATALIGAKSLIGS
jgi:hypothetical protein